MRNITFGVIAAVMLTIAIVNPAFGRGNHVGPPHVVGHQRVSLISFDPYLKYFTLQPNSQDDFGFYLLLRNWTDKAVTFSARVMWGGPAWKFDTTQPILATGAANHFRCGGTLGNHCAIHWFGTIAPGSSVMLFNPSFHTSGNIGTFRFLRVWATTSIPGYEHRYREQSVTIANP